MKPFAEHFYHSKAWQRCRDAYFTSQHGICEKCDGAGLIVHHKTELTPGNIHNPAIAFGWDNLELLCLACHNAVHLSGEATAEGLAFDAEGNLAKR